MPADALDALRTALMIAMGLGGCAPQTPAQPPRTGAPTTTAPAPAPATTTEPPQPAALTDAPADTSRIVTIITDPPAGPFVTYTPPKPGQRGLARSPDGIWHRATPQQCPTRISGRACTRVRDGSNCVTSDDCRERPHGKCTEKQGVFGEDYCTCEYSCADDSECPEGQVCTCGGEKFFTRRGRTYGYFKLTHGTCVPASCTQDSDCASGLCARSARYDGCSDDVRFACRTDRDTCITTRDCPPVFMHPACALDDRGTGTWNCVVDTCRIGRPLLVDGVARVGPSVDRDDWHADLDLRPDLPPPVAAALAEHWTRVAALEHASVASFARFTLELLALGAPPDLLAEAQRAALDEVEHARLAFALATRFAGRPVGPGSLPLDGALGERDLAAFVTSLVVEACVGETLGAAELRTLASHADPSLAPLLTRIADDEQRHAALAWKTLRWLLAAHGEPVRTAALAALEAASRTSVLAAAPTAPTAPAWGLLDAAALAADHRRTFTEVVLPLLRAALSSPASPDASSSLPVASSPA